MTQNAENVLDHFELFRGPEYQEMFKNKREKFEDGTPMAEVERVTEWTKTPEYQEKNFAREALTVNPAKACQPLGAVFAAVGFEGTLPFVHGSQGCVAYYRSHFSRHFKEPTSCVSSSMTEDAAVFGGLNNMIDGLANSYTHVQAEDDRRLDNLHGGSHRRRPERLHQDLEGKGLGARRTSTFPSLTRQPSSAATSPATTTS